MALVYIHTKQSNVTYVYDSKSYRDPITKQPRSHRKLIGKLDDQGNIVETRKKSGGGSNTTRSASGNVSVTLASVQELINERDQEITSLKRRLEEIEKKLQMISEIVNN